MAIDLNISPYHDDFDEKKNLLQILFRGGDYAVQSRELTQLQSIFANQIGRFGSHVFEKGSKVYGGQTTLSKVRWAKLEPNYLGSPINVQDFVGKSVTFSNTDGTTTQAKILDVAELTVTDPNTLYFEIVGGGVISSGATVETDDGLTTALLLPADAFGSVGRVGLLEGTFFIENRFVYVPTQSLIIGKYNIRESGFVGLEYETKFLTEADDESFYDPAFGTPNYTQAGAHRLNITANLKFYASDAVKPENFITVIEIEEGAVKSRTDVTIYSDIAKELARRTYDESGDYTVRAFTMNLSDDGNYFVKTITSEALVATATLAYVHDLSVGDRIAITNSEVEEYNGFYDVESVPDAYSITYTIGALASGDIGSNVRLEKTERYAAIVGPGKAYVKGFEREYISNSVLSAKRARDTDRVDNYSVGASYGNYVVVTNLSGAIDPTTFPRVSLYTGVNGTGTLIGSAAVRYIRYHSGTVGLSTAKYRLYLFNFEFVSSESFAGCRSLKLGSFAANVDVSSISSGAARLSGANLNTMVFSTPHTMISTMQPDGTPTTSYIAFVRQVASSTGTQAIFNVADSTTFVGPLNANFAGTDTHLNNYHFVNSTDGSVLEVSSIVIDSSAQQLTVNFTSSGVEVDAILAVQKNGVTPRVKTSSVKTDIVNTSTMVDRRIYLTRADGIKLQSVKIGTTDVTDRFTFDSGQKDSFYEHCSIVLKVGQDISANTDLTVVYDYFQHTGTGFFSVDSYSDVEYSEIPYFYSAIGGSVRLSDVIDFRPIRSPGSTNISTNEIPVPDTLISTDYEHYLPRRDILVIRSTGTMEIIEGISSSRPVYPPTPEDAMLLYELDVPAYTMEYSSVQAQVINNRRYTMKNIGTIDKRVGRLEYVTALSYLESKTQNTPVVDPDGFERFKNGFIVDVFEGHAVGDVFNSDYKCSIDPINRTLRPAFDMKNFGLKTTALTNMVQKGNSSEGYVLTLPYTSVPFTGNLFATAAESVNPFLIVDRQGSMITNPANDDWLDTTRAPDVNADISGNLANWNSLAQALNTGGVFGTQWGDWNTIWTGVQSSSNTNTNTTVSGRTTTSTTTTTTTTVTNQNQVRNGVRDQISFDMQETSLGDRVVDVNIIPFMRAVSILCTAQGLRPNRDLHIFFDGEKANSFSIAATGFAPVSEGVVRSDANGKAVFTINLPSGRFRTGDRIIKVIDDANDSEYNATTFASYTFSSSGLQQTKQEVSVSTRVPVVNRTPVSGVRTITSVDVDVDIDVNSVTIPPPRPVVIPPPRRLGLSAMVARANRIFENFDGGGSEGDPLAQTFRIPGPIHPNGVFIDSVSLFFKGKSSGTEPVWIEIRPVVNGYPDSFISLPFGTVYKNPDQVNIPANTNDLDIVRSTPTKFDFSAPVYLEPGKEYAVIVLSNDASYEIYKSVLGQPLLGSDTVLTDQPHLGSMFKSQNSSTWTPFQYEDLMMVITRAEFDTSLTGFVDYNAKDITETYRANVLQYNGSVLTFSDVTSAEHSYRIRNRSTGTLSDYAPIYNSIDSYQTSECVVDSSDDFVLRTKCATRDAAVSPVIDLARSSVITVHNLINFHGLVPGGFRLTNPGSGYAVAPTVTITGGGGNGAIVNAIIDGVGTVTGFDVVDGGSGYTTEPTITLTGNATAIYEGVETDPTSGNCLARYMTRAVILSDEFETDFLKSILDVNLPAGTDVEVYYKAKSVDDPIDIQNRPWVKMVRENQKQVVSGNPDQFFELAFIPENGSLSYTSGGVTYSSSKTVVLKIVMLSRNSSRVPTVKNFRTITAAP